MALVLEAVEWSNKQKDQFLSWMHHELFNTIGDRASLEQKWRNEIIQWRAKVVGDGTADVPFVGASNLEMPLTAIHSDPVYADLMQTLHIPADFWSVVGKKPDTVDKAAAIQQFLGIVAENDLHIQQVNANTLLDTVIHGTGIYKDTILYERKVVKDYDDFGQIQKVAKLRYKPSVQHVPLRDFFIPAYARSIDPDAPVGGAPWVAHRYFIRKAAFKLKASSEVPFKPAFDPKAAEIVELWDLDDPNENETLEREEASYTAFEDRKITLYEIHARFDVDGDGIEEDIVVDYHWETNQILRAIHNPHLHGKRPFESLVYMPSQGFYGIGIAEMDYWAQLAASDILNATIDSAKLGNAVMLAVPYGANFQPDEPIYPGKIWPLGPNEKIQDIKFGSANPDMFNLLGQFMQMSEQRTGVPEIRQGNIGSLPSRTPASTILSVLREGKKRFDMILSNARSGPLKRLGVRLLQNLIQISHEDPLYAERAVASMGEADAAKVLEILQGPLHDVEDLFGISVTATSSQTNKELDKQNLVALAGTMAQLTQGKLQYDQLLMQLGLPEAQQFLVEDLMIARLGTVELQRRILEAYDIQNPDQYISPSAAPQPQQQQQQPGGDLSSLLPLLLGQQPIASYPP